VGGASESGGIRQQRYFNRGILATQATAHVLTDGSPAGSMVDKLKAHIIQEGDPLRLDLASVYPILKPARYVDTPPGYGVGPLDAGGVQYSADLLVPDGVRELAIRFEAKADWRRAGVVPAEMRRTILLPHPPE